MRLALIPLALLALCACASKPPPPPVACADDIGAQNESLIAALDRLYPDPKGVHDLVGPRVRDAHGDLVMEVRVWPLSGPQEPAPPHRARIVLAACTAKTISAVKLPD